MLPELTNSEKARYARHLSVPGVGVDGQRRLKASSALIIGTGGLGAPAALYLAAAGVGRLGLVDDDLVERSNLQRQIIHSESAVGKPKLESAAARLRDLNPEIEIITHPTRLRPDNAAAIAADYDVIIDGSDNFPTRFLTNDLAFFQRKPCVYGAIFQFDGQVSVFAPHRGGACYRCMLPSTPPPGAAPSCAEAGVLGVLPGVIGSLQAMEAIKWLLDLGELPLGKLICYDALRSSFRHITIQPDPQCALCGKNPSIHQLENPQTMTDSTCSSPDSPLPAISVDELAARLKNDPETTLIDVREPEEYEAASIAGSQLIPLAELPDRLDELPRDRDILVHCKSGGRSARAVAFLHEHGLTRAINISGGIDAWLAR